MTGDGHKLTAYGGWLEREGEDWYLNDYPPPPSLSPPPIPIDPPSRKLLSATSLLTALSQSDARKEVLTEHPPDVISGLLPYWTLSEAKVFTSWGSGYLLEEVQSDEREPVYDVAFEFYLVRNLNTQFAATILISYFWETANEFVFKGVCGDAGVTLYEFQWVEDERLTVWYCLGIAAKLARFVACFDGLHIILVDISPRISTHGIVRILDFEEAFLQDDPTEQKASFRVSSDSISPDLFGEVLQGRDFPRKLTDEKSATCYWWAIEHEAWKSQGLPPPFYGATTRKDFPFLHIFEQLLSANLMVCLAATEAAVAFEVVATLMEQEEAIK
ncbi:hypothetical protein BDK51DRAFT_46081 [Blyttiomyces helicus]|uniref:Uncharacterized protein n=1 Tax=Blyttiomyces helicus TaxID=388810 RepID=A0A4P9WK04_9FUNG|nr:hypothetical protein BDK51DRAFT_46081 [Blyttiomyces helicus]|eukprot:RKO93281.1 hypothetical protein BDK51DRAFT_46081 [Blyttiomyces helicus]